MTNIFFQNGMMNNYKTAGEIATLISETTNRSTGMIVNNTGMVDDVLEYIPDDLVLRDALNGEVYQQIDQYNLENNQRSLLINHSAGNNDSLNASKALRLSDVKLNNTIDIINVASPHSENKLKDVYDDIGLNHIGTYNNWKDPVTHSRAWGVGIGAIALAGGVYGSQIMASLGMSSAAMQTGIGKVAQVAVGGGIGGGITLYNLNFQHPYTSYHNKDFKGLKSAIEIWSQENPVNAR